MMNEQLENLIFDEIHNLKWYPFIGEQYFNCKEENKMLIVGESHYSHDTEESKSTVNTLDFTRAMIEENAIEGVDWKTKIIPNFHKAMFGDNAFNTGKFWNLVSYYNFIQRPMLTIGERPNDNDFYDGWKTFFDLIKVVKPKTCLFIGVSASNHLMSAIRDSDFSCKEIVHGEMINGTLSRKATLLDNENNEINIIFIKHTSQYFSWSNWNDHLKSELPSQINWFEKNIDISEIKFTKEKLNAIYCEIDKELIQNSVDTFKYSPPAKSGEYSDCFTLMFEINKYSLAYEIDIENFGFCSYYWNRINEQKIPILTEKGKELGYDENWGILYDSNQAPKEIAAKIIEEILKIISILK